MLKANSKEAVFIGYTDAHFIAGRALDMETIGVRRFRSAGTVEWMEIPGTVFHDVPSFEKYILSPEFDKL